MKEIYIFLLLLILTFICFGAATPGIVSFNAGEVSPLFYLRSDFNKYNNACQTLENMLIAFQGPVIRRPGTKYIAQVKDSNYPPKLFPFEYSVDDIYIIEAGDYYMRFFRNGGQILSGEGTEDYSGLSNIIAHWLLNDNEPSTDVIDDEGNHNGTATKNTDNLYDENGNTNGCFDLEGKENVVISDHADFSFTDDSDDDPFTLTAWIFITETSEQQTIISKWQQDTDREYRLYIDEDLKLNLELFDESCDMSNERVAHWKLNDNAANTHVDDDTTNHDGVATSNTNTLNTTGKTSDAFDLDNAYAVEVNDDDELTFNTAGQDQPFSISCWIYPDWDGTIISKYSLLSTDYREWRLRLTYFGALSFILYDESTVASIAQYSLSDTVAFDTWSHIVVTYDGSESNSGMKIYLNNELLNSSPYSSGNYYGMENLSSKVAIGAYYNSSGTLTDYFNGIIDNVIIFDSELNTTKIASLYNGGDGTESTSAFGSVSCVSDDSSDTGWHYVAATYSAPADESTAADGITFYVDGKAINSTGTNNSLYTAMQGGSTDIRIGAEIDSSDSLQYVWSDKIDNVAIFSEELNSTEVASIYDSVPYEIETIFDCCEVWNLRYVQADNYMYLVDGSDRPQKLTRTGHTDWSIEDIEYNNGPFLPENDDTSISIEPPDTSVDITDTSYAFASSEDGGDIDDEAFDNDFSSGEQWTGTTDSDEWIGQDFGTGKMIKKMKIWPCGYTPNYDAGPKHIKIEASNDGTNYDKIPINKWYGRCEGYNGDEAYIDEIATVDEYITLYLDNDESYQYWRIYIDDNWGNVKVHILEIEMFEEESGIFTSTGNIFKTGHVESVWQINQERETTLLTGTINDDEVSDTSVWFTGDYSFKTEGDSWEGVVTLQRSTDYGGTWQSALTPLDTTNFDNPTEEEEIGAIYRVKGSDWVSGNCDYTLIVQDNINNGTIKIDSYLSPNTVSATILEPLADACSTYKWREPYWSDYRSWPKTIEFHEQRLFYGGSESYRQHIWGSVTAEGFEDDYEDMEEGLQNDDDAIIYILPGQNPIQFMLSQTYLLLGTSSGVGRWGSTDEGQHITPNNPTQYRLQSKFGSDFQPAIFVGDAILYVERGGNRIREFAYSLERDKFETPDMTILAEHITESGIVDIAYQSRPGSIYWCVREDGQIATLTYERYEDVVGWSRIITDGEFESIAVTSGDDEDEVWVEVKRTINGSNIRYIEQFQPQDWGDDVNDCWFVDSGLNYDGSETDTFPGLDHLIGENVYVLADGVVESNEVVDSNGSVTIDSNAAICTIGLPFTSKLKTMPFVFNTDSGITAGRQARIASLLINFYETLGTQCGVDDDSIEDVAFYPNDDSNDLYTGYLDIPFLYGYSREPIVYLKQDEPLPMTIRGILPKMDVTER